MSQEKRPAETNDVSDTDTSILKKPKLEDQTETATKPAVKGIQEIDVGITSYISQELAGFTGTIKQRYTDFLVNEIDTKDNVIHLNDQGLYDAKKRRRERREKERDENKENSTQQQEEVKSKVEADSENKTKGFELDAQNRIKLLEIFGEEELTKIEELVKSNSGTFESQKVFGEKKERGQIHQLFRTAFEGKLETKTTDSNNFLFTIATRQTRKNKQLVDTRDENGVENWGLGPLKPFLHFNLYKENKDTMEAASLLSRFLRLQPRQIRYAGTKDRRGVTVQKLSIAHMKVERVNSLNKTLRGLKLGGFSYEDYTLSLGDLHGNEFIIALRDVQSLDKSQSIEDIVTKSVSSLKEKGFINYYGMQRFGTFSISTHTIGKEILSSNWKTAVELILSEQELALPESVESRKIWNETKDAKKALDLMPRKCVAEHSILKYLSESNKDDTTEYSENDYFFAINKIPRNLRIMYGHAYQSYIWNRVASRRMELFGLEVVAGDLILEDGNDSTNNTDATEEEKDDFEEDIRRDKFQRARAITRDEINSKKFTIYDVVLPTPGFDIKYPENEDLANVYKEEMGKDGLDPLDMVRKTKEFSFAGSYRNLVAKAKNLEYHIRNYNEPTQQLLHTDLDLLHLKEKGETNVEQILPNKGGDRIAVILKFQLEVSSYATMALREVMKADTSRHGELCDVKV